MLTKKTFYSIPNPQTPIPNPQLKLHLFLSEAPSPSLSLQSLQPKALAITRQNVFPDSGRLFHWLKDPPLPPTHHLLPIQEKDINPKLFLPSPRTIE